MYGNVILLTEDTVDFVKVNEPFFAVIKLELEFLLQFLWDFLYFILDFNQFLWTVGLDFNAFECGLDGFVQFFYVFEHRTTGPSSYGLLVRLHSINKWFFKFPEVNFDHPTYRVKRNQIQLIFHFCKFDELFLEFLDGWGCFDEIVSVKVEILSVFGLELLGDCFERLE